MHKTFKILALGCCLIFLSITLSAAAYNNSAYFRKNVTFSGSNSTGLGTTPTSITDASAYTIDSDTLYVELWEAIHGYFGGYFSFCCAPNQSATVVSNAVSGGIAADSVTLTLKDYVYTAAGGDPDTYDPDTYYSSGSPSKFINVSPGITITLGASTTPSTAGVLEVEDGQTLSISPAYYSSLIKYPSYAGKYDTADTATDTATVSVASDTVDSGDLVIRSDTSFGSGSVTTGYIPGTSKVYAQLTDTNCNKKGYTQETVSLTISSLTGGDSESITLTETGSNTGIFQYTTGLSLNDSDSGDSASILLISSIGDTITASYTDANDPTDTETTSLNSSSILTGFSVSASSPQTAGTPFAVTITALKSGGTLTTYSGTVTLTVNYVSPGSGSYTISPTSTSSFTDGVATVNVTYADAGTITITATDTNNNTGTSNQILMLPANFLVESTGGTDQVVGKAFNVKVTARNSSNNTTPNYNREVNLTATSVTPSGTNPTISPSSIAGSGFSSGIKTVSMTYNKWGTAKITATDSGYSTVTGVTSSAINFYPNSFSIDVAAPPASRSKFYIDETFDITVKPLDYSASVITNYAGNVTFPAVSNVDMPDDYTFLSVDSGQHAFSISADKEKAFKASVKDKSYTSATGESSSIDVIYGKIRIKDASGPIGIISTAVEIVDKKGKVIDSDDSTTFVVTLLESKKNNSATSSTSDLTVSAGKGTISITDTELESVTVTPDSTPELDAGSGVVTFSETAVGGGGAERIGSGARILFWRELRKDEAK